MTHRSVWFRSATPAEREIIDRARADLWRGVWTADENLMASACQTMTKMLAGMRTTKQKHEQQHEAYPMKKQKMKKAYEGSLADKKQDKAEAKKRGMSLKNWENSPEDKKAESTSAGTHRCASSCAPQTAAWSPRNGCSSSTPRCRARPSAQQNTSIAVVCRKWQSPMKMKKMRMPKLHMKKPRMRMPKLSNAPMGKMPSPLKGSSGGAASPMPGPNEFSAGDEQAMRQGAAAARAPTDEALGAGPAGAPPLPGSGDENLA